MSKKFKEKHLLSLLFIVPIVLITLMQVNRIYIQKVFANSPLTPPITIVDLIPPTVSLINPLDNSVVSGLVSIDVSAIDDVFVENVLIFVDQNLQASSSAEPYSALWDTTVYPHNSLHEITAYAFDSSNNSSSDSAIVRVSDITSPTASMTSPLNGSIVSGQVTIQANASDNDSVTMMDFLIDGVVVGRDSTSPYSYTWDTTTLTQGSTHTLTADAYDQASNKGSSSPVNVTIADTTNPAAFLTSPQNGSEVTGTVSIQASATDNVGVSKVEFYVDNVLLSTDTNPPYSAEWDTSLLLAGSSHSIYAKAYDTSNNAATSTTISVTIADITAPTIAVTSPTDGSTVSGVVNLTASASDNLGVTMVDFLVDGVIVGRDSTYPYTFSWDTTIYQHNTSAIISADAYDSASNKGSTQISVSIVDITIPQVSITNPTNGSYVPKNTTIIIEAQTSDISGISNVEFYVDGTLRCTDSTTPYTCPWKVPARKNVGYALSAKAFDVASNNSTSTISVTSK